MFGHSSRETAKKLGISFATLNRYIAAKKIPLPALVRVGGVSVRLWNEAEIERLRALLPKIANGRKTRHQKQSVAKAKPKTKKKPQPRAAVPHVLRHDKQNSTKKK